MHFYEIMRASPILKRYSGLAFSKSPIDWYNDFKHSTGQVPFYVVFLHISATEFE